MRPPPAGEDATGPAKAGLVVGVEIVLDASCSKAGRLGELLGSCEEAGLAAAVLEAAPTGGPRLDPLPLLGAAAHLTTEILLGAVATFPGERHPAVLAKQMTTVDVLSAGRGCLLLSGATPGAMDAVVEAAEILRAVFGRPAPSYGGRHYQVAGAVNLPPPARPGGPLLAAVVPPGGERGAPRLSATVDALVVDGPAERLAAVAKELHPPARLVWRLHGEPAGDTWVAEARGSGAEGVLCRVPAAEVTTALLASLAGARAP